MNLQRLGAVLLSCVVAFEGLGTAQVRQGLTILVIEGEGNVNDIQRGFFRPLVLEVRDENDKPVAGAKLTFSLPESGPSGTFFGAGTNLNVTTNERGRTTGVGFRPNEAEGRYMIRVTAVQGDRSGTINISQSNFQSAASSSAAKPPKKFWKSKLFAVIAVGAITGIAIAARGGDDASTTVPGTTVTPGTISVGTPR